MRLLKLAMSAIMLIALPVNMATAGGPHFGQAGGIGASNSTYNAGEPAGGTYSINGLNGNAAFNAVNSTTFTTTSITTNAISVSGDITVNGNITNPSYSLNSTTGVGTLTSLNMGPSSGRVSVATTAISPGIQVGSGLYPTIVGGAGTAKYDSTSNFLTNVVGSKYGMFGLAAKDGAQWPSTSLAPIDNTGVAQLYSISTAGNYGIMGASRSSDSPNTSNDTVGTSGLAVCDNTTAALAQKCRGVYALTYVKPGSSFLRAYAAESTLRSDFATVITTDPYSTTSTSATNVHRLACGDGVSISTGCSSFLTATGLLATAKSGIIFSSTALDTSGRQADMLAGTANYAVAWYSAAATPTWRIYGNSNGTNLGQFVLGDNSADIFMQSGTFHPWSVSTTGVTIVGTMTASTFAVAGSQVPTTNTGTCTTVGAATGGVSAGTFTMSGACNLSTTPIKLVFPVTAAHGWICTLINQTTITTYNQSANTTTSCTIGGASATTASGAVMFYTAIAF